MDDAYTRLRARLSGLTDEEFFWQPVADAWTIYED
ncbi:MAG: DinB family protein, partial [Chloroflexi bacterium]